MEWADLNGQLVRPSQEAAWARAITKGQLLDLGLGATKGDCVDDCGSCCWGCEEPVVWAAT